MRFTKARDELLIELVKGHSILYDTSDENFKNNIIKHKSWEEISAIVGFSVPECKKRWKSLRDQYNKKKKGDMTGGSSWEYMIQMSFLSDTVEKRDNSTNGDEPIKQTVVEVVENKNKANEEYNQEHDEEKSQQSSKNQNSPEDPLSSEVNTFTSNKVRFVKRHLPRTKIMAKRRQRSALYEKTINKAPVNKTPTQKFFESMADIVERLPNNLQAEVRLKVCQIVTEAELKHETDSQSLYAEIQSHSFDQFPNMVDYPNMSSAELPTDVTEIIDQTTISCDKFKVDVG